MQQQYQEDEAILSESSIMFCLEKPSVRDADSSGDLKDILDELRHLNAKAVPSITQELARVLHKQIHEEMEEFLSKVREKLPGPVFLDFPDGIQSVPQGSVDGRHTCENCSDRNVKVETFLELQSSIHSRLDIIQHSLEILQASKASKDDIKAITTVADTLGQSSPLSVYGQHPLPQNALAEIEEMLDNRFQEQSANLVKMSNNVKNQKTVDVQYDQDDSDQTSTSDKSDQVVEFAHRTPVHQWAEFQEKMKSFRGESDDNALYAQFLAKGANPETFDVLPRNILRWLGYANYLPTAMPDTCAAHVTNRSWFNALELLLIVGGTTVMALQANENIKAALKVPKGEASDAFVAINILFNAAYGVDLLFRICALKSWFLLSSDWKWNLLDVFIVTTTCATFLAGETPIGFLRSLRVVRLIRVIRVIRVLRFFRELQKIMLSIWACIGSLVWCFIFLGLSMFIMSLFIMQMLTDYFEEADPLASDYESKRFLAQQWYGSIGHTMWSVLLCCIGGVDLCDAMLPLEPAGRLTEVVFVAFVIFVAIGVMNVLTGAFLSAAAEIDDRDLSIQTEQMKTEKLVMNLCSLFKELDVDATQGLDWPEFERNMKQANMQAYLASLEMDGTHAHLLFDLLDVNDRGFIDMADFVKGMAKLSGNAKALDARAIQKECAMMPRVIEMLLMKHRKIGY